MWPIGLKIANFVHSPDVDLQDSKSTSGGLPFVFGSHTFVLISWLCKKETAVSHIIAESEIVSHDVGLRVDGWPAIQFGECVL